MYEEKLSVRDMCLHSARYLLNLCMRVVCMYKERLSVRGLCLHSVYGSLTCVCVLCVCTKRSYKYANRLHLCIHMYVACISQTYCIRPGARRHKEKLFAYICVYNVYLCIHVYLIFMYGSYHTLPKET
jgi:hypothetical protein